MIALAQILTVHSVRTRLSIAKERLKSKIQRVADRINDQSSERIESILANLLNSYYSIKNPYFLSYLMKNSQRFIMMPSMFTELSSMMIYCKGCYTYDITFYGN